MLRKIWCNPMHQIYGTITVLCVPVRVTRGALVTHPYTYVSSRCSTPRYRRTFPRYRRNDLDNSIFDGLRLAGFKNRANAVLLVNADYSLFVFYCFPFPFFISKDE